MEVNYPHFTEKAKRDYLLIKEALEQKSQSAYTQLMEYYKESLFYLMLKMCNNPCDAEDLTLEAFGKAFSNLDKYTTDSVFSTWLFKIATNNCVNYLKKKKNSLLTQSILLENNDNEKYEIAIASDWKSPYERLEDKQTGIFIKEILKSISPKYRNILELRYFKEYSYEEIAQELALPLGTVKTLLYRAKASLEEKMRAMKECIEMK